MSVPTADLTPAPVKRRRRVFMWTFLAVQALFVVWIVAGLASAGSDPSTCGTLSAKACSDAAAVGTGIGVMLIVGLWVAVDFILAVSYGIYRLATRKTV